MWPSRLDWELARRGFARYAAYPGATVAGILTNVVFGFMRMNILLALFAERSEVGGYDAAATVTYVWVTQGLLTTVMMWGWQELALRIRTGDIATDLVRPIHPLRSALDLDLGRGAYHALFRGAPPVLVGALAYRLTVPGDPLVWIAFLASVTLAVVASFGFRALYNCAAFWLLDHRGAMLLAFIVTSLLSGFTIPIRFFPEWLAAIARATPFPSMIQTPVDVFVGATAGPDLVVALATQAAWCAVLLGAAWATFERGTRKLVIQGG
jgi:ABC-2 type transport system permease protein